MGKSRLEKLRECLAEYQVDVMLTSKPENIRYLSGFTGSSGVLIVSSREAFLLTDFRYAEQARSEAPQCNICVRRNSDSDELVAVLRDIGPRTVGFESHFVTVKDYDELAKKISGITLRPLAQVVERLRAIKEEGEVTCIAAAARIGDAAFSHILPFIKPGVTEKELALELEFFMIKNGAEKAGFDIIVAFGARSSMPHARTSEKKLYLGEFIKMDFGAVYKGYHADMTRTVILGRATERQREIYRLVCEAQELALNKISAGQAGKEADEIARSCVRKAGYGENFGHNLGHGLGLEIHEIPVLGPKSEDLLKAGMTFTVEPGIYIPGFGGVRVEDSVVLRKDGVKVLTGSTKELLEL
ncbi:MAG: Xaa-Pro peptidase family protein [Actinomycetota bacterium]|nr:Xaa-Pro peptidase family protein [Actinomycetota bacterium]